jgi:hypothetical protein
MALENMKIIIGARVWTGVESTELCSDIFRPFGRVKISTTGRMVAAFITSIAPLQNWRFL